MLVGQIKNSYWNSFLFPLIAVSTLIVNSGCHEISEAKQLDSRVVAHKLAQEEEIADSNKQYQAEIE